MTNQAMFYGIGVGTGDPELLTLKAVRLIQQSPLVCYLVNQDGYSQARHIARLAFDEKTCKQQQELSINMPMKLDRKAANQAYDQAAMTISKHLSLGQDVAFLCEGDPLFFGSFTYLLDRLHEKHPCQVVPGISTLQAASAALVSPLTQQNESLVVVSGRHGDEKIHAALQQHDTVVIMKISKNRQRILDILKQTGRTDDARYLEYIGREQQQIIRDVTQIPEGDGIYFSVILVTNNAN